jgi:asparagine synthase (glutamine-hydrolysing)
MLASPTESETTSPGAAGAAGWLVTVGSSPPRAADRTWLGASGSISLSRPAGFVLLVAESPRTVVIFSGVLTNAAELDATATAADAARLVLAGVESTGERVFGRLRGAFAVLVWDRVAGTLRVARDQLGLEPIFYAHTGESWLLSSSPDVLVAQPAVPRAIDAVALSEWICGWFPAIEDTAYRSVKRLAPATVLTVGDGTSRLAKYWDPFPEGQPVEYLRESELGQFEAVLSQAVGRAMTVGPAAILLSGGLDSIAVAAAAADAAGATGSPLPLALSLVFPAGESNEAPIQMGVAAQLGLEQRCVPLAEAVADRGLLAEALSLSAGWPQPMWNLWAPAYSTLAGIGAAAGRRLLLTGRGGDEWLTISPYLLADLLPRGHFGLAWKLLRMRQRSNQLSASGAARLLWLTAGRPIGSAILDWLAPTSWHRRRRRRLLSERPDWIAPDPAVRGAMDDRIERWIEPARPRGGFYQREARLALRHPAITHDMEETQEFGRRHGMRMLHPFWDVDLIELAHRVPPALLMKDGRSKWLLRRRIAERLPGLGLERRGKVSARGVFRDVMDRQAPAVWNELGGVRALADIGVVRTADIESRGPQRSLVQRCGGSGRLWTLLNLETWVRQRV